MTQSIEPSIGEDAPPQSILLPAGPAPWLDRRAWIWITALFVLSRLVWWALGLRFVTDALIDHWQFIDISLLRDRLAESLWYLHCQPPLMNLLCGLAVKMGPAGMVMLNLLFVGLGLVAALCLYPLLRRLGVGVVFAVVVEVLFLVNPTMVLYENYLFYSQPMASLLCLSCWSLDRFLSTGRTRWAAACFWCMAVVVLTRSMYHLSWLVVMSGAVVLLCPRGLRRRALVMALLPLLASTALYAKNKVLFGDFSATSWMSMSLTKTWNDYVSAADVKALQDRGELSAVASMRPFREIEQYQKVVPCPPPTGVPVLDHLHKADGSPNYNHRIIPAVSRLYMSDFKVILKRHPKAPLRSQLDSWGSYFRPASEYTYLGLENLKIVAPLEHLYNRVLYLQLGPWPDKALKKTNPKAYLWGKVKNMSLTVIVTTVFVFLYIPFQAWRLWRSGRKHEALLMLFLWLDIAYVSWTANLLEVGENHRYRYEIEPLWTVLLAAGLADLFRRWRGRKMQPAAPGGA